MTEITGVAITDLTAFGSSDDGRHVWVTHRLPDGSEYRLMYPYEAIGFLMSVLADAARTAYRRRAAGNPREAAEGMDSKVIAAAEVRVGTSPNGSGAILHLTTNDNIPIAFDVPMAQLGEVVEQLQRILDTHQSATRVGRHLH
jgi:hypothetical protein